MITQRLYTKGKLKVHVVIIDENISSLCCVFKAEGEDANNKAKLN